MVQILESDDTTGDPFTTERPFFVSLDTYADGWFLEFAVTKDNEANMNWKKWHTQPLREHGDLSHLTVVGVKGYSFRMNRGTQGATAFRSPIDLKVSR